MKLDLILARIGADNDQDQSECDQWMRDATDLEKIEVWETIQKTYTNAKMEIVARFAQLAFGQAIARWKTCSVAAPLFAPGGLAAVPPADRSAILLHVSECGACLSLAFECREAGSPSQSPKPED